MRATTATERNQQIKTNDQLREERNESRKDILVVILDQIMEKYELETNIELAKLLCEKGCDIKANHISNYYNKRNVPAMDTFLHLCQVAGYSPELAGRLGWGDKSALTDYVRIKEISENELIGLFLQARDHLSLWALKTLSAMVQDETFNRLGENDQLLLHSHNK